VRICEFIGGCDVDIVFEYLGWEMFGVSVFVACKGGMIVMCVSMFGYMYEYDNWYFWMNFKCIVGLYFVNYCEVWEVNDFINCGLIYFMLSCVYFLDDVG